MTLPKAARSFVLLLALAATPGPAVARGAAIRIIHPWTRPTTPHALTGVGYLTIENKGDAADRLVGASSPAARSVELHQEKISGAVMSMAAVPGGLAIPAHARVTLAPGGYHLMLVAPGHPFQRGQTVPVTLDFEHAGPVKVGLSVEQAAPSGGKSGMNMPGMR